MMMIMKLKIKLLLNLVRQPEHDPHQSGTVIPFWKSSLDQGKHTNNEEAMMSPDSDRWLEAMKSEIGSMYENKVWTLVDLPNDRQAIENIGSSRGRRMLMVVLLSTKLDFS